MNLFKIPQLSTASEKIFMDNNIFQESSDENLIGKYLFIKPKRESDLRFESYCIKIN